MDGNNEYLIFRSGQSYTNLISHGINHIIYLYFRNSINALSLGSNDFGNQSEENVIIEEVMAIKDNENEVNNSENEIDNGENEVDNSENKVDNDETENGNDENVMTEDEDAVEDGQKDESDNVRQVKNNKN
jgi:hypothetical protein